MKRIYTLLLAFSALFTLFSCEEEDRKYSGPLYVEFCPDKYGQTASPSGIYKGAEDIGTENIGVQLIGLAVGSDLTVNFRIADQIFYMISLDKYVAELPDGAKPSDYNVIPATAKYGVDYTFDGLSGVTYNQSYGRGTFTIKAGTQFGTAPIEFLTKTGASTFMVLEDSDGLRANVPTGLLRIQTAVDKIILLEENFATDPFGRGWTEIDKDGDGYTWEYYTNPPSITSDSYRSSTALLPENYLVSPQVTIPADANNVALSFQVASGASGDYKEQYRVLASENPITSANCRNADVVQDWTELTEANTSKKFTDVLVDLAAYKGKSVYIAILHGNCTNQYFILLRNLSIYTY